MDNVIWGYFPAAIEDFTKPIDKAETMLKVDLMIADMERIHRQALIANGKALCETPCGSFDHFGTELCRGCCKGLNT